MESTDSSTTPPPQKRKRPRWLRILKVALPILAIWVAFQLSWGTSGRFDFYLRCIPLTSIVRQVKAAKVAPGDDVRFQSNSIFIPRSLKLVPPVLPAHSDAELAYSFAHPESIPSDGNAGTVFVHHDKAGWYAISIVTKDLGHLGYYGYIYSEEPLDGGDTWATGSYGILDTIGDKVSEHWWVAYNNKF